MTDAWLKQIAALDYQGINRVFAWSFYSQGQHQTYTNSTAFFQTVLPFLGVEEIPQQDIDKARCLAHCLQQQAVLLILDGLEPLQQAPQTGGFLQDGAIKEFLAQLRRGSRSFVLLSSRQSVNELEDGEEELSFCLPLETLKANEGALLLEKLKVDGNMTQRQALSENLGGHALSLVLCGHLLQQFHHGDITYAKELPPLSNDAKDGGQARRVLQYYDSLLTDNERWFMYALTLFDRPMDWREKQALFSSEDLQDFENLGALAEKLEQSLESKGLLLSSKTAKDLARPGLGRVQNMPGLKRIQWDTHPLIRQFFCEQFQQQQPQAYKAAHRLLFDYYQQLPEKHQPDTLEELTPLYRAVVHGCLAGEYEKAHEDIYIERIGRGTDKYYSLNKLGAFNEDLSAIIAFFPQGWEQPVSSGLSEITQGVLLSEASYCLMSLGRLAEAIAPREVNLKLFIKLKHWSGAFVAASNLVNLHLSLAQLQQAEITARQAIDYAQHSDDKFLQITSHSKLAKVQHCLGNCQQARSTLIEAEKLQQQHSPDYPYLYSISGADYCELLLDLANNEAEYIQILERATTTWELHGKASWTSLLSIAYYQLSIALCNSKLNNLSAAEQAFQQALSYIQKAGTFHYFPKFYISRADFYLQQHQLKPAREDLNSAWDIINRSDMKLYATDASLTEARYHLTQNHQETAQTWLEQAEMLINETSYHLRDQALAELKAQL